MNDIEEEMKIKSIERIKSEFSHLREILNSVESLLESEIYQEHIKSMILGLSIIKVFGNLHESFNDTMKDLEKKKIIEV